VDKEGNIVRDESKGPQRGRGAAVAMQELKPGQERKELEGVFVVRENKAIFTPVKTGIAGEKYFEVLSGANVGDQVIVGPFSSVRELKDGQAVKTEVAPRSTTTATK
jgi:HlyD family secretion protein